MYVRSAAAVLLLASLVPAQAAELKAEEARRFVVGKLFSYTCFEGTRGAGRIHADGSVSGTIQLRGSGPVRHVRLPPNTLQVRGESVCASLKGLPFDPCFKVHRTSRTSFRGSLSGFGFAYCEFNRRGVRLNVARTPGAPEDAGSPATIAGP